MRWSKLKQLAESMICPELQGRVEYFMTTYRKTHDAMGKGWITVDKEEIYDMCTITQMNTEYQILRELTGCNNLNEPDQIKGYYTSLRDAEVLTSKRGIFGQHELYQALKSYLSTSIEDAVEHKNPIIKALAIIDKRLGKRRLQEIRLLKGENELVRRLYGLRCDAEGITPHL